MTSQPVSYPLHQGASPVSALDLAATTLPRHLNIGLRSGLRARLWLASLFRMIKDGPWAMSAIAFGLFLLSRPYQGIVQDAELYMGRVLADLDPSGVGRDLMFVHDGQSGFTLFRFLADGLAQLFGLAAAAKILAFTAALAWFAAAQAFARQFITGSGVWVALVFVSLLPSYYGVTPSPFSFAEPVAIPRPFAEAFVLASLAALASRRDGICLCWLTAATLVHPIMALAGMGVWLVVRGLESKRWFLFGALTAVLASLLSWFHIPLFDRIWIPVDPLFRDSVELRKPYLFPTLWPVETYPPLIVQAVTLAISAHLQQGRRRTILAAIIAAALAGICVTAIFGDWLSSLLVIQAQPWRMTWLMAATGAMALGLCCVELWPRGTSARMVTALLVLAWTFGTQSVPGGPAMVTLSIGFGMQSLLSVGAALGALALHIGERRYAPLFKARYVFSALVFAVGIGAVWQLRLAWPALEFALAAPAGYGDPALVIIKDLLLIPLGVAAVYFAIARPRIRPSSLRVGAILLLTLTIVFWDRRSPAQRMLEEGHAPPDMIELLSHRQGEVLWIDGLAEAWFLLDRPQWASRLQRGPAIFSPSLSAEWRRRIQLLMNLKLVNPSDIAPWKVQEASDEVQLTEVHVRQFCTRDDAPPWIVVPLEPDKDRPVDIAMTVWSLPEPVFQLANGKDTYIWRKIDAYGIIPCVAQPHPQPS